MSLNERVRVELRAAAGEVQLGLPADIGRVKRRALRRRRTRRGLGVGLTAIPVVMFVALAVPFDPNSIDPATTHGVETIEIADLAVPVVSSEPVQTGPDVWVGLRGPLPRFDTTLYGPDLGFGPGEPHAADLDERLSKAVYLGELNGEPFYIYSGPAPSIWDRMFEMIDGNLSGETLGTTLNCCSGGDMDHEGGLPGFSMSSTAGLPDVIVAEWLGLSLDVSVVAFRIDGEFVGWQTPVGGTVSIRLEDRPVEVGLIALDEEGEELARFEPFGTDRDSSSPPDASVGSSPDLGGFVSDELQIDLVAVRPVELREVIELRTDSRLFAVPIDGNFVYTVVGTEYGHLYSERCELLESAAIPEGIGATCLIRTVNGETEVGVFDLPEDVD